MFPSLNDSFESRVSSKENAMPLLYQQFLPVQNFDISGTHFGKSAGSSR